MGIGDARRGRDAADDRRAAGHYRSVPGRGPDRAARRRIVRSAGARGGRQAPGFGVRRRSGGAGMGDGQSGGAAQQSADRHGEHAHRDAGAAKGQARGAQRQRTALHVGKPAQTAAHDARGEGHEPG